VLLLDEPTANLDIHSSAVVRKILRGLVADGVTVLLTTHNMQEVEEACDRVAILCRGKLVEAEAAAREADTISVTLTGFQFMSGPLEILHDVLRAEGKQAEAAALVHERMAKKERALNERLTKQPGQFDLLCNRGRLHGRMGRWGEAVADLSRAVELKPDDHVPYHFLAAALVEGGDLEAYGRLCAQIPAHFGGTESPEIATQMARACLIVPSPEPPNIVTGSRLADTGVTLYKGDLYLGGIQSCKTLAEYRQGRFASDVEWALKALSQPEYCSDRELTSRGHCQRVEASMLLAMSNYQLHRLDEARAAFAKGLEIAVRKLPKLESGDLSLYWDEWVFAQVLMREAKALIEGGANADGETKTSDPSALRKEPP